MPILVAGSEDDFRDDNDQWWFTDKATELLNELITSINKEQEYLINRIFNLLKQSLNLDDIAPGAYSLANDEILLNPDLPPLSSNMNGCEWLLAQLDLLINDRDNNNIMYDYIVEELEKALIQEWRLSSQKIKSISL